VVAAPQRRWHGHGQHEGLDFPLQVGMYVKDEPELVGDGVGVGWECISLVFVLALDLFLFFSVPLCFLVCFFLLDSSVSLLLPSPRSVCLSPPLPFVFLSLGPRA
jgi:hypothetical protein